MFVFLSNSTVALRVTSTGEGAPTREPSVGMGSVSLIAGEYWAEPKMYERKKWSSRPQTPWEPAGSRVYVKTSLRMTLRYLDCVGGC